MSCTFVSCTPNRPSGSRAWTATRRSRSSSAGSKALAGLEALDADVVGQRLRIQYDAAKLTTARIAEAVAQTGMRAWLEHEEPRPDATTVLARAAGGAVGPGARWPGWCCSTFRCLAAVRLGALSPRRSSSAGTQTARRAWRSLVARHLDINVLMMVAVAGAMALGEWAEGASVVFLFALAQVLEARAMERARGAIRALMDLAPATALVRRDGVDAVVGVDEVRVGDLVVVRPGEKIPLDGRVRAGDQLRQPGAGHGRIAAGREGAAATMSLPARSTAAARSTSR